MKNAIATAQIQEAIQSNFRGKLQEYGNRNRQNSNQTV